MTPPAVAAVAPANAAFQVASEAAVEITFNEDLATEQGSELSVALSGPGGAVAGSLAMTGVRSLLFTPADPLSINSIYQLAVNGAIDLSGTRQTSAFTSSFATVDTIPPTVSFASSQGPLVQASWLRSATPSLTAAFADSLIGVDMTRGVLQLDGVDGLGHRAGQLTRLHTRGGLSEESHTLTASGADRARQSRDPVADLRCRRHGAGHGGGGARAERPGRERHGRR